MACKWLRMQYDEALFFISARISVEDGELFHNQEVKSVGLDQLFVVEMYQKQATLTCRAAAYGG